MPAQKPDLYLQCPSFPRQNRPWDPIFPYRSVVALVVRSSLLLGIRGIGEKSCRTELSGLTNCTQIGSPSGGRNSNYKWLVWGIIYHCLSVLCSFSATLALLIFLFVSFLMALLSHAASLKLRRPNCQSLARCYT